MINKITEADAEYLRIQLMRTKDSKEAEHLRKELHTLQEQLRKQHQQLVVETKRC